MALTSRKKRPFTQGPNTLRDDRLFVVACDDTYAPHQYFGFFRLPRIQVHVVPTTDGTSAPKQVLDRLLSYELEPDDQRWLLLDTDHFIKPNHIGTLKKELQRARKNGVKVALSMPCFEVWLLLHHDSESVVASLGACGDVVRSLADRLSGYDKTSLRDKDFPFDLVPVACQRAASLDIAAGGEIPQCVTSRVHLLWREFLAGASPAQVPKELRSLVE